MVGVSDQHACETDKLSSRECETRQFFSHAVDSRIDIRELFEYREQGAKDLQQGLGFSNLLQSICIGGRRPMRDPS